MRFRVGANGRIEALGVITRSPSPSGANHPPTERGGVRIVRRFPLAPNILPTPSTKARQW